MICKKAYAEWRGDLSHGMGFIDLESEHLIKVPFSYAKRFSEQKGTGPEELLAASVSSCFAMTFAHELEKKKISAENINVMCSVFMNDWHIKKIELELSGFIPKADEHEIHGLAEDCLKICPIIQLLKIEVHLIFKNHNEKR